MKWLIEGRVLLVFHATPFATCTQNPFHQENSEFLRDVVRLHRRMKKERRVNVLFVEWDEPLALGNLWRESFRPEMKSEDVAVYFDRMVAVYSGLRGTKEIGTIVADRARWARIDRHYGSLSRDGFKSPRKKVSPASVRFRAACLSNIGNFSAHDATQGFHRLIGMRLLEKAAEFSAVWEDVRAHLQVSKSSSRGMKQIWALRLVSTGLYSFSKQMLESVLARRPADCSLPKDVTLDEAEEGLYVSTDREVPSVYVASMTVKSIVQDDWRSESPNSRAWCHEVIGDLLVESANRPTGGRFKVEYPFPAPWNDETIIFRSEAIRHYVRAAESSSSDGSEKTTLRKKILSQFHHLGEHFDDYQHVLRVPPRHLSMGRGQYRLKLELLHLLLQDPENWRPAGFLKLGPASEIAFLREIGIAFHRLLMIGQAEAALRSARLRGQERWRETIGSDSRVASGLLKVNAHLISVLLAADNFDGAQEIVEECVDLLGSPRERSC